MSRAAQPRHEKCQADRAAVATVSESKQLTRRHGPKRDLSRQFWKPSLPCDRAALLSVTDKCHRREWVGSAGLGRYGT